MVSPKLVARYSELKGDAPGCVLLMQVGTFMQVMGDDARASSHRLERSFRRRHPWLEERFLFRQGCSPRLRVLPSRRAAVGAGW